MRVRPYRTGDEDIVAQIHSESFVDSRVTQEEAIRMYERVGFEIERRQNCWVRFLR